MRFTKTINLGPLNSKVLIVLNIYVYYLVLFKEITVQLTPLSLRKSTVPVFIINAFEHAKPDQKGRFVGCGYQGSLAQSGAALSVRFDHNRDFKQIRRQQQRERHKAAGFLIMSKPIALHFCYEVRYISSPFLAKQQLVYDKI